MKKYSYEFKKKVVLEYKEGKLGYILLCEKYHIADTKTVRTWLSNYQQFGDKGLLHSRKKQKYTFNFKLSMVELYLTSELSYREIALQNGLKSPSIISKWVGIYRKEGTDGLRDKKEVSIDKMDKQEKTTDKEKSCQTAKIDTSEEHVKELESELLKLRIENAYLKELRRLRLEKENLQKQKQELYTVSEESSN